MTISSVDRNFLYRCEEVRSESFDPHRSVGAVIVSSDGLTVTDGTNKPPNELGFSRGELHALIAREPQSKYFLLEHAERNALSTARKSGQKLEGATIYCSLFPCADCARAIVSAGISRLVVPEQAFDPVRDIKWEDHYRYARTIFDRAQVRVDIAPNSLPKNNDAPAVQARG